MDKKQPNKVLTNCGSKSSYSKLQPPNATKSTFAPAPGDNKGGDPGKQTTESPKGGKRTRPGPPPPPPPTKPPSLVSCAPLVTSSKRVGGNSKESQDIPRSENNIGRTPEKKHGDDCVSLGHGGGTGNSCGDVTGISSSDNKTTLPYNNTAAIRHSTSGQEGKSCHSQVVEGIASPGASTNNCTESDSSTTSESNNKAKVFPAGKHREITGVLNNNKSSSSSQADVNNKKRGEETSVINSDNKNSFSSNSDTEGYRRKSSTPLRSDSESNSSPRLKYKKTRPAPPPPKPPDVASSSTSSKKGGALTQDSTLVNKLVTAETLNQSDSEAKSDLSSNHSSVSNSPRLSHKSRFLVGKKSLIVKPSTPPPAPPREHSKHQGVMKTEQHVVKKDSVSDNTGLCASDLHINSSNNDRKNVDINRIITAGELGTVNKHDQGVSKPQDLQKLGDCDKLKADQINSSMVVDVNNITQKEMQGDKLKTVIPNDNGDTNSNLAGIDNTSGSTQIHSSSNTVVTNACGSTKPHMRSPIHSQKPKRRKNHFALALCCGLGGMARPESPLELELPMRTEGTLPRGNDVIVRGNDTSDVKLASGESSRSLTSAGAVILPGAGCESKATTLPKGKQNVFDALSNSPETKTYLKVTQTQSCHSLSIEKPVIQDVKLLKSTSKSPMPVRNQPPIQCPETDDDVFLPVSSPAQASQKEQRSSPVKTNTTVMVTNPKSLEVEEVRLRIPSKSRTESDLSAKLVPMPRSQSVEDVSCVVVDLDLDTGNDFERNKSYRSSFMSEDIRNSKPALFQAPGEFQTILKHSKEDTEKLYALPQPACYGDSTLKAVKLITEKYDTLQRWKLRAMSFREDTLKNAARMKFQANPVITASQPQTDMGDNRGDKTVTGGESPQTNGLEITVEQDKQVVNIVSQESLDQVDNTTSSSTNNISQPQVAATIDTPSTTQKHTSSSSGPLKLSKENIHRIKVFFSSTDTQVVVCGCSADLMLAPMDSSGQGKEWDHQSTGVPVLVLNTGDGRTKRGLNIVLAERETGFSLWEDKITYLSQYKEQSPGLHTMHLSSSLMKIVGFQFHDTDSANEFLREFREITKDSNDELWRLSRGDKRKYSKRSKNKSKTYIPVKGDISQPLQFEHVTNIDSRNPEYLRNIGNLMTRPIDGQNSDPEEVYRTRTDSS